MLVWLIAPVLYDCAASRPIYLGSNSFIVGVAFGGWLRMVDYYSECLWCII